MVLAPLSVPPHPQVLRPLPVERARATGHDEAYADEQRLARRWQDRVQISAEAIRLLEQDTTR